MAEDELFDLSKKKKKKKTKFTLDDADGGEGEAPAADAAPAAEAAAEVPDAVPSKSESGATSVEPSNVDDDLSLDLKKKKKKKKAFEPLDGAEEEPKADAPAAVAPAATSAPATEEAVVPDLNDELLGKKKKKKKAKATLEDLEGGDDGAVPEAAAQPAAVTESAREYTYAELLERIFSIMKQKNPEMVAGEKKQMTLKPPQVHRLGTRRTAFGNFSEYCKMLRRQPEHMQNFLIAELGASASVDGSSALVMRGRFSQKQIENVLRRYIREYVTCHTCKSPDTNLLKENRLFFLQCESCGSRCSVASIRAGFQAVTGKRAAMRAKTEA